MDAKLLFGNLIFGGIGFVAFAHGRKMGQLRTSLMGVALMAYPYFVSDPLVLYLIGAALTACLFIFKE